MDRQIVYPGQILPETTLLQMTKDTMIGVAKLASATLGTNSVASGFAVTPTGPASLQVLCAPGEIYSMATIDALAFSTLPADTTHSILKQGIMLDGVTLSCPAPGTTGQSINYLVQVTYQDSDATPVLLPYYNSANPSVPYSGMGNNGLTQNTVRKGIAVVSVKAGASATTGSQTTPSPDPGYIGLYVVTVAFGQTTITSSNISQLSGALLLTGGLLQLIQNGAPSYAVDFGTTNNLAATLSPYLTSLTDGLSVRIRVLNTNLGPATLNLNGTGAIAIRAASAASTPSALIGFEMTAFYTYDFVYSSAAGVWLLKNPGRYADVTGNGGSAFSVGPATQPNHAIQYGQATGRVVNQVFITANGTYTPTAGITYAIVECVGGGGGSAHVIATGASQFATTAGGQAGGYTKSKFNYAALAGGIACSIGNGGVGANAGGVVTSSNGGVTSFGSLVSAGGGSRSTAGILSTGTYLSSPQGTPTTATGSFLYQIAGQPGTWGTYSAGSGQLGGCGGSSPYGGGGVGVGIGATAVAGSGYGAGGGASSLGPSSASIGGAAGSPGVIIVTEYV